MQFRARKNSHLPGSTVASGERIYLLEYLPISEHYKLTDTASGMQQIFPRLRYLVAALESQRFTLLLGQLAPGNYQLQVRAEVDLSKLPAPMRLPALIAPEWQLSTDWHSWPFEVQA